MEECINMPYCSSCGNEMTGPYCGKCGSPAAAGASQPPASPTSISTAGGLTDNVAGALCYILGLITGVIFLVVAPYNTKPGIRFHAFQAILFNVAWVAIWIVIGIVMALMPYGLSVGLGRPLRSDLAGLLRALALPDVPRLSERAVRSAGYRSNGAAVGQ